MLLTGKQRNSLKEINLTTLPNAFPTPSYRPAIAVTFLQAGIPSTDCGTWINLKLQNPSKELLSETVRRLLQTVQRVLF